MPTERIRLKGPGLDEAEFAGAVLEREIGAYCGVRNVRAVGFPEELGGGLSLTVVFDEMASGRYDDTALHVLKKEYGLKGIRAERKVEG
ncbi:MAG TPA: hypothetical protein VK421_06205 [Pyrinomonadaceae bacterium]|nr:hypothetical protein [Pyrinomonadaceae bacterium]